MEGILSSLWPLLAVVIVLGLVVVVLTPKASIISVAEFGYRKKKTLFTEAERSFLCAGSMYRSNPIPCIWQSVGGERSADLSALSATSTASASGENVASQLLGKDKNKALTESEDIHVEEVQVAEIGRSDLGKRILFEIDCKWKVGSLTP